MPNLKQRVGLCSGRFLSDARVTFTVANLHDATFNEASWQLEARTTEAIAGSLLTAFASAPRIHNSTIVNLKVEASELKTFGA